MMVSLAQKKFSFDIVNDMVAGTAVFFVALPLCLGIALASGAPLVSGLLAGIVGGVVVGAISGSQTSVSGPTAGLTAVVAAQIATLGSFEAFLCALIIAGFIQILFGVSKLGFISSFFPSSVIKGLLAAIGIILILKQLPHLIGWDVDFDGEMSFWQPNQENTFSEIERMLIHPGAAIVGFASLFVMVFWEKLKLHQTLKIPSAVIVVPIGVGIALLIAGLGSGFYLGGSHLVQVPMLNSFAEAKQLFVSPEFSKMFSYDVMLAGITLAVVASLETLIELQAVDNVDPLQRTSPANRELIAQGVGNALLGFVGGIPMTAVVIRGTVNVNAGAKSKRSTIFHGVLMALLVVCFPFVLNSIPLACLAAVLIITGFKLSSPKIAMQMWRQGLNQFVPFAVTVAAIVFSDLLTGVITGLVTSALFILHSNLRRPLKVEDEVYFGAHVTRISLANQVSFLNRAALSKVMDTLEPGKHVLFDATQTDYIDADILDLIEDFRDHKAPAHGVAVSMIGFRKKYELQNLIQFPQHSTNELQKELTPKQVLQVLKEGNVRVRQGRRINRDLDKQILATSHGQFPHGVFLSCIDSRAPAELIFDLGIGDMFSARIAGNTISEKILGSLEFACAIAGAKLIVVMGHTRCGAVSSAVDFVRSGLNIKQVTGCQHVEHLVEDIQKIVRRTPIEQIPEKGSSDRETFEEKIVKDNIEETIQQILHKSSTIKNLVLQGQVVLAGCMYDVKTGEISFTQEIDQFSIGKPTQSRLPSITAPLGTEEAMLQV